MDISESDIQALKAQEAKDLCIELLNKLREKERAPISPGELQIKELEYDLRLKEAEAEDNRKREAHALQIKELERQIEQERTRQAEAEDRVDEVRREHARVVEQVQSAQEALSIQYERATREHALKLERLDGEYATKADALRQACSELEDRKTQLTDEIAELSQLHESAGSISALRQELETRETAAQRQLQELDERLESAEFDKTKQLKDLHRQQELEIAELEAQHKKQIIQLNRQAADKLVAALDLVAVEKAEWERYQQASPAEAARNEEELAQIRQQARDEFRREYHITTQEPLDVTELFYDHKTLSAEATSLRNQIEKLEQEIRRMREHIEHEPQRIATAVEAAKVQIQNNIEQASPR